MDDCHQQDLGDDLELGGGADVSGTDGGQPGVHALTDGVPKVATSCDHPGLVRHVMLRSASRGGAAQTR
jgi:hypothetical protein